MNPRSKLQIAQYGSWRSPITSELIVSENVQLSEVNLDGEDTYWVEMRPKEGGRNVIVHRKADGQISDAILPPFNARTRVHEFGGGSILVNDRTIYFSNFMDQRIYCKALRTIPEPLTPQTQMRYSDGIFDKLRKRLIYVREDHTTSEPYPINTIVSFGLKEDDEDQVLASGNHFYSSPRLSPDSNTIAWLTWNHPNMPWDGTELWISKLKANGSVEHPELVAGGINESIFQPEWSPDGILHFVSDRTKWWNLYGLIDGQIDHLAKKDFEFGRPQWKFGMSTYSFLSTNQIICSYIKNGISHLAILDTKKRNLESCDVPYTQIKNVKAESGRVVFIAGSPTEPEAIIQFDFSSGELKKLRCSSEIRISKNYLSIPQNIDFQTEQGNTAYAFFYPPKNGKYRAPAKDRPPLLVVSHGGPTGSTSTMLNLNTQYWTSRGIGVLDVNYGGSTGYGRDYRQRLNGQWGIVDVDDCVNGAKHLVQKGLVDENMVAIRGNSAGGYTTLAALTFRDTFNAGASYYGISDLEALAKETHKFESRYLDNLIAPYPEKRDRYQQRSPIHHVHLLSHPIIFFQGLEDEVVPPNQSEKMFKSLLKKGLPTAYVSFEGEEHGFRRAETIKRSLEGEYYFYSKIFNFKPAESIEELQIENLDQ